MSRREPMLIPDLETGVALIVRERAITFFCNARPDRIVRKLWMRRRADAPLSPLPRSPLTPGVAIA